MPRLLRVRTPPVNPSIRWVWAAAAVGQLVVIGLGVGTGSLLLAVFAEALLLACLTAAAITVRFLGLLRQQRHQLEQQRREHQRRLVAEEVHDLLGHEISLMATRAGLLQLRTEGAEAELAGELRRQAERAVATLHDTIGLLEDPPQDGVRAPAAQPDEDVQTLVAGVRAAGQPVEVRGELGAMTTPARLTVHRLIREGLTNALRHAPGRDVVVELSGDTDRSVVSLLTRRPPEPTSDEGGGLSQLRRRVESLGGSFDVSYDGETHRLWAQVPTHPTASSEAACEPRRSPTRTALRGIVIPVVALVAVLCAFYVWGSHDATLEPAQEHRLEVGMPVAQARDLLPARQAPVRLVSAPAAHANWTCRSYTNGNAPLAIATIQVCWDAHEVTRVTDLRKTGPR